MLAEVNQFDEMYNALAQKDGVHYVRIVYFFTRIIDNTSRLSCDCL